MRFISVLSIFFFTITFAQINEENHKSNPGSSSPFSPITFEAVPYWSADTASIELMVFYRIKPEFFFFAKSSTAQHEIYEAHGELVFEIFDEKDAAVAREFRPLRIERNSLPEEDLSFSEEVQGALSFKLKKGLYKIVVESKDSESGKSFLNRDTKIDTRTYPAGLILSPAIFVDPISTDSAVPQPREFFPMNRGGSIIIGQRGGCLLQVVSADSTTDIHLSWQVKSQKENDEDYPQELAGERFIQVNGTPVIHEQSNHASISIVKTSNCNRMVYIPIPIERLETGTYDLRLTLMQGLSKSTKNHKFNIIWPLKPHSLYDFKLAVDAVRHIATEQEVDSMTAFSSSKSMAAFREFWHKRNPDTTRAFNPAMTEYYRRVDETIKRFSSANETDGYRTDRGRIYILFGSPSLTNHLLKPNSAPTEIWTYTKLNQRFTFTDQRKTGNYILSKVENY